MTTTNQQMQPITTTRMNIDGVVEYQRDRLIKTDMIGAAAQGTDSRTATLTDNEKRSSTISRSVLAIATIDTAVELIQKMLEQITNNDAPAQNEYRTKSQHIPYQPLHTPNANGDGESLSSTASVTFSPNNRDDTTLWKKEDTSPSRIECKSTLASTASTELGSNSYPSNEWEHISASRHVASSQEQKYHVHSANHDHVHITSPERTKMGHSSLVSLCLLTLDTTNQSRASIHGDTNCASDNPVEFQPPNSAGDATQDTESIIKNKQHDTTFVRNSNIIPTSRRTTGRQQHNILRANKGRASVFHFFKRNKNTNDDASSSSSEWSSSMSSGYRPRVVTDGLFHGIDEEKKDDAASPSSMNTDFAQLQLFGSEYARYLSTCQLAPNNSKGQLDKHKNMNISSSLLSKGTIGLPRRGCVGGRRGSASGPSSIFHTPSLEDASQEVQNGALLDIVITENEHTPPPKGYYRITKTSTGQPFILPSGGIGGSTPSKHHSTSVIGSNNYYINVKKEPVWDKAAQRPCVTAITIIYPDRNEFVPPGFCAARIISMDTSGKLVDGPQANLNGVSTTAGSTLSASTGMTTGSSSLSNVAPRERIYLCFRRSREGNPITGVVPLSPYDQEPVPIGYTVIERTPRNFSACLTAGLNTRPFFLAYRQRLATLETLRPLPLLKAVRLQVLPYLKNTSSSKVKNREPRYILNSYYCTGGTTVDAVIGRFHIMDRSTHSLLSPSSVSHRMNLIELSRRKARNQPQDDLLQEMSQHTYKRSVADEDNRSGLGDSNDSDADWHQSQSQTSQHSNSQLNVSLSSYLNTSTYSQHDCSSVASIGGTSSCNGSSAMASPHHAQANLSSLVMSNEGSGVEALYVAEDPADIENRRRCRALNFIPTIESALSASHPKNVKSEALLRLQFRIMVITPILTSCYTRHGGVALIAVEGLTKLVTETDFFTDDVDLNDSNSSNDDEESIRRISILDLAIQTVCDVATSSAQETLFPSCLLFVERAVSLSQAQLNVRTIGIVLRFYVFVFYFDASIPRSRTSTSWPPPSWRPTTMLNEDDFPMLYDLRVEEDVQPKHLQYLPGGSPQVAALALKDLISFSIIRLGKVSVADLFYLRQSLSDIVSEPSFAESTGKPETKCGNHDVYKPIMASILSSIVDDAVDHVDRANYAQLTLHQIHRSGGSELFWHEMVEECGRGLFGPDTKLRESGRTIFIVVFAMLQQFVKVSSGKLRANDSASANNNQLRHTVQPKDLGSKLLSLELLLHFLEFWSDEQEAINSVDSLSFSISNGGSIPSVKTFGYVIRRTVVPCLLWNTQASLDNAQVYRRIFSIMSELWGSPIYRFHCKIEIAKLVEHFVLSILELGPQIPVSQVTSSNTSPQSVFFAQQVELLSEIKTWFSNDPQDVIDFYLNYDTDLTCLAPDGTFLPAIQQHMGSSLQLFQRICAGLSNSAEKCGDLIADQIVQSQKSMVKLNVNQHHQQRSQQSQERNRPASIPETGPILDQPESSSSIVMDSARLIRKTSVEAIEQIVRSIALSAAKAVGTGYWQILSKWTTEQHGNGSLGIDVPINDLTVHDNSTRNADRSDDDEEDEVIKYWRKAIEADQKQRGQHERAASTQETIKCAFQIAEQKNIRRSIDYLLACNYFSAASPKDIAQFLHTHANKFKADALGDYLSEGGTTAQEVEYCNSLRYQFVRCNTFIGMTVDEGLRNFLSLSGFKLPGEAQRIDRMLNVFAQVYFEDNVGDSVKCPFPDYEVVYIIAFAMIMLNTDLHCVDKIQHQSRRKGIVRNGVRKMTKGDFINNFRGAERSELVSKDFLSRIYDSIESHPILMKEQSTSEGDGDKQRKTVDVMIGNVRSIDSMLRGLAVHDLPFTRVDEFVAKQMEYQQQNRTIKNNDILIDIIQECVGQTWHHWYSVVNTCMENAHLDPHGMEPSITILLYALCATICLNMSIERTAFLNQLYRLKEFEERRHGRWVSSSTNHHNLNKDGGQKQRWIEALESSCAGTDIQKMEAMTSILKLGQSLQLAIRSDVPNKVGMAAAITEIIDGAFLLHDPSRSYIRSGNLMKKSGRTGRQTEYRFYLFSDTLLYASKTSGNNACEKYQIHEELPLYLMKVVDWFPPNSSSNARSSRGTNNVSGNPIFEIHHPRKRFQCICSSVDERKSWVDSIRGAISAEMDRKVKLEQARLSIYNTTSFASSTD